MSNPTILDLILLGLATWRVSSLITQEDGPADMFVRFRRLVGVERAGEITGLATLFSCIWCVSMWVAPVLLPLTANTIGTLVLLILSASTISIIVQKLVSNPR